MKKQFLAVFECVGYFLLFLMCQAIVVISITENEIVATLISDLLFLAVIFVLFYIRKINIKERLNVGKIGLRNSVIVIAVSLAVNLLFQSFQLFFPENLREELVAEATGRLAGNAIVSFITIVILAPIVEEMLFRGLMFGSLKKSMNVYVAACIQAVIFGILHGNLIWMIIAIPTALFYAFLMERFKTILAPMFGHLSVNLLAFILG